MLRALFALAVVVALPASAEAQGRAVPQGRPSIPANQMPPAGKCRIWMDGVPAAQQPAPTDCQTALRQKPANGTVIFGPSTRDEPANAFRPNTPASRDTARPARGRQDSSPARPPANSKAPPRPRPDSTRRPDAATQQLERTS
jgi:hypothetical protein